MTAIAPVADALQWTRGNVLVKGLNLHWEAAGPADGERLLMIMGMGCQLIQWPDSLCAELAARGFRVIRFDNRDAGFSGAADRGVRFDLRSDYLRVRLGLGAGPANYLLHDMAADAIGLADALGHDRVHLVGASMGGMIAQIAAATYPRRVRSLTSIMSGTNHSWTRQTRLDLLLRMNQPLPNHARETVVARSVETAQIIGSPAYPTSPDRLRSFAERAYDRAFRPGGSLRHMHAIIATGCFEHLLDRVTAPTQIIHGTADAMLRPACGMRSARFIAGARLEMIKGMGHDCPPALMARWADLIAANAGRA